MAEPKLYHLTRTDPPWGDYGDMLIHGMAERTFDGVLQLERSGPFIPPISQPSNFVVVTADFLSELRESGLTGFAVAPVVKKRIPKIDWLSWEPYGPLEFKYPAGNEPENYILRRKHSEEAADGLGELFELQFKPGISDSREGGYHLVATTWNGSDFFVPEDYFNRTYVSQAARDWLVSKAADWVRFETLPVK